MSEATQQTQWFSATSGRISGWMGVVTGAATAVVAAFSGSLTWVLGGVVIIGVVWMVLLRPRVGLRGRTLLLRGIVSTVEIPLSKLTSVTVRQMLVAWVGDRRYVNAALGLPLREVRPRRGETQMGSAEPFSGRGGSKVRPGRGAGESQAANPYIDQVLDLIRSHQADAQRWGDDGGDVRRHWALPEIVGLSVAVIALIVLAWL